MVVDVVFPGWMPWRRFALAQDKWSTRLATFDVYIWDQCYSMEQTLRIE